MTDDKGAGEGPYTATPDDKYINAIKAQAYAEGRKSMENYTELMLKHATAEVRRCTEEVVYLKQVIDELKALCVRADARMDYVKHKYKIFEGGEISASQDTTKTT